MTQAYCCHIVADFHQFTEATKGISCAIIGLAIPLDPDAVPGETTWIHEILDLCVVMVSAEPGEGRTGSCPFRRQLRSTESACFLQSKPTLHTLVLFPWCLPPEVRLPRPRCSTSSQLLWLVCSFSL